MLMKQNWAFKVSAYKSAERILPPPKKNLFQNIFILGIIFKL